MKRGPGRPSKFTPEIAALICERLLRENLRAICEDDGMPDRGTVQRWMEADRDFAARCARSRVAHADYLVEGMDELEKRVLDGDLDPAAARVVLASQQWRASKLGAKHYGERTVLAGDPEAPVSVSVDMTGLSAADLRALAKVKLPEGDV